MLDVDIAKRYLNKASECKSKRVEFSLTFAEFKRVITTRRCKYTGVLLTMQKGDIQKQTDVTIDRVDNLKGYVTGNVVACCNAYNSFKATFENPNNIIDFEMVEQAVKVQRKLVGGKY